MEINQYQIVAINPGNSTGNETRKASYCVVLSPNEMNGPLKTIVVAPLAPDTESYPTRVKIKINNKTGRVALDQITSVGKERITKIAGDLSAAEIRKIKAVLKETYVD